MGSSKNQINKLQFSIIKVLAYRLENTLVTTTEHISKLSKQPIINLNQLFFVFIFVILVFCEV